MDSEIEHVKKTRDTQQTEWTVCESVSESNDSKLNAKHIESVSGSLGEIMDSVVKDANLSEQSCIQMEHSAVHSVEMQMNTGSGNLVLHYSDLDSKRNISSVEMPMDSGSGKVALHYSDLDLKRNISSVEMPMDSGGGKIALHYSDLDSKRNISLVEMPMDSGGGKVALHYSDLDSKRNISSVENVNGQWQWQGYVTLFRLVFTRS